MMACYQAGMSWCVLLTVLLTLSHPAVCYVLLRQSQSVMLTYLPTVTETTDGIAVPVTGGATSPGIVDVTFEDVERNLQQPEAVIIDVRKFDEVAEFGHIPTAHVLPGCTAELNCGVKYTHLKFDILYFTFADYYLVIRWHCL